MALNIKDPETERLATEIADMTGETKTGAIRRALQERKERLSYRVVRRERSADLRRFLEDEIWPVVPAAVLGRPLSRQEEDDLLGYGRNGA
jgi:antitoxin VapB